MKKSEIIDKLDKIVSELETKSFATGGPDDPERIRLEGQVEGIKIAIVTIRVELE